jgi:hypothetical protein
MRALIPLPHCQTCGQPCKARWCRKGQPRRFCSRACIPRQLRVEAGQRGRVNYVIRARLRRYRSELKRLQALERITAQELVATFAALEAKAWDYGYAACENKWQHRHGMRKRSAAA